MREERDFHIPREVRTSPNLHAHTFISCSHLHFIWLEPLANRLDTRVTRGEVSGDKVRCVLSRCVRTLRTPRAAAARRRPARHTRRHRPQTATLWSHVAEASPRLLRFGSSFDAVTLSRVGNGSHTSFAFTTGTGHSTPRRVCVRSSTRPITRTLFPGARASTEG